MRACVQDATVGWQPCCARSHCGRPIRLRAATPRHEHEAHIVPRRMAGILGGKVAAIHSASVLGRGGTATDTVRSSAIRKGWDVQVTGFPHRDDEARRRTPELAGSVRLARRSGCGICTSRCPATWTARGQPRSMEQPELQSAALVPIRTRVSQRLESLQPTLMAARGDDSRSQQDTTLQRCACTGIAQATSSTSSNAETRRPASNGPVARHLVVHAQLAGDLPRSWATVPEG